MTTSLSTESLNTLQCFMTLKPMVRFCLACSKSYNSLRLTNELLLISNIESILTILKDPSFELGQPSWVRRSPPSAGSMTFPSVVMPGSNAKPPSYLLSPLLNVEEVDYPMEGEAEEIMMEFQEDEEKRERASLTKVQNLCQEF